MIKESKNCYSHTEKFRSTKDHGGECFQKNKELCQKCHGTDFKGGPSKKSCDRCHQAYPHEKQFAKGSSHGKAYLKKPQMCIDCHRLDGGSKGINSASVCFKCHNYPHPKSWALAKNHGQSYVQEEKKKVVKISCLDCHKKDGEFAKKYGASKLPSCDACHVDIPHEKYFRLGWHNKVARTYAGKCERCHEGGKRLMRPGWGCVDCHGRDVKNSFLFIKEDQAEDKASEIFK